jgi:hypothetical protein
VRLDRSKVNPLPGKKVAICGFAESYKLAPFDDPSIEVWGLNELWKYLPRWDRWWEVHDAETLGVTKRDLSDGEQKRHLEWLSKHHGPNKLIYMQPQFCDGRFPNAVPMELDRLCETFMRYFTSSIGYMVGQAIADGYSWIGLYGIDLASDIEYQQQRANTELFVGIALGLGIEVELAPTSAICKGGHLYGVEKPIGDSRMVGIVKNHLAALRKKHDEQVAMLNTLDGAIQESENFLRLPEFLERGVTMSTY